SVDNRQTQARFLCVECGFEENADLVGAINILRAGHAHCACEVSGAAMPPAAGTHRSDSFRLDAGVGAVGIPRLWAGEDVKVWASIIDSWHSGRPLCSRQRLKAACTAARSRWLVGARSMMPWAFRAATTSSLGMKVSLPTMRSRRGADRPPSWLPSVAR